MTLAKAIFQLGARDELSALIRDVETGDTLLQVQDDADSTEPFYMRVRDAAAAHGYEVAEWDRSALAL